MSTAIIAAIVGVLTAAFLAFVGFLMRWVFSEIIRQLRENSEQIASNTAHIAALEAEFEQHEKWHRHRVVEVGSSIDLKEPPESEDP